MQYKLRYCNFCWNGLLSRVHDNISFVQLNRFTRHREANTLYLRKINLYVTWE